MRPNQRPPIAVVGVSALFPGSLGASGFWRDILAGTDRITDVPASHWLIEDYYDADPAAQDKTYARRGAFLRHVDFDALGWGVPPSIIPATDTSQLLALIVAQQVLDDAARSRDIDRSRMSVILGITSAQELLGTMVSRLQKPIWQKSLREAGIPESEVKDICERIASHYVPWQESSFPGVLGNVVAGRIANRLDLGGTNCVTDAACASTFSALSMAINELYLGDSDVVIAGGVDTMNDIFMYMCFSKTPALSASGDCRPFSDQADGTMLGEGLGMFALKRLEDAERDDDHVYAVIRSVGSSSDGRAKSVYAPRSSGQASAIRRAYDRAGVSPSTVELVEAHGTGTKAGDAAEFGGLTMAFDEAGRTDRQWCALGSVKSQIGHTKSSAGAAGLIKAILAIHGKALPPTIKVDRPNPKLEIEQTAFYLNTEARPWVRGPDHPRRAGVSSFGFGGSNFHVVVEEYKGLADLAPRMRACSHELVVLSGDDVVAQAREHATLAEAEGYLGWLSHHTLHNLDATAGRRLSVVATDDADLAKKLRAAADRIAAAPDAAFDTPDGTHYGTGAAAGPVALLFPGQGSQYVSMGGATALAFETSIAAWDAAAPMGLHGVVFPPPAFTDEARAAQSATLTETQWAQPAIGVASLATLKLLSRTGIAPIALGGHSYGEVTALHAGGVFSEADLLSVAQKRGALMAEAAKLPGAMLAVTATIEDVRAFVAESRLDLVVANHNHPTQVVLSGAVDQIDAALAALPAAGLRGKRLSVATAFHSPIVSPSAEPFAAWLEDIDAQPPMVPVYGNATAAPYPAEAAAIRAQLAGQIASPVRFVEMIEAMYDAGARVFVEVGPGSVLTGLVGRILKGRPHHAVATDRKNARDLRPLLSAFGKLFAAGVPMSAAALWADYAVPDNPHTRKKPRVAIPLNGSNYGKPYPPPGGAADLPPPNPPRPAPEPKIVRVEVPVEVRVEVPVPAAAHSSVTPEHTPMSNKPKAQPRPALPSAPQPVAPSMAWIEAWQAAQQHTADAHSAYQRAMADAHTAFLKTAETSFMGLSAMASGHTHAPAPTQTWQPPAAAPAPAQTWQPTAAPVAAAPAPSFIAETPVAAPAWQPPAATPAPAPITATPSFITETPVAAAPTADLHSLLLDVVAEKTGYPAEMLTMDMQLEGDLGIDSIKRVEILSAMQEKEPSLPEVDASAMASLQTLGQIADYMGAQLGSPVTETPLVATTPAAPTADLHGLLLDVVAEKTGYPAEMLTMDMQLEGDLGIDSIKRVEILSAMQEKEPSLPEVDASAMASLQTLGQIADYMGAQLGSPVTETPITATAPSADLHSLLLGVVAEKTGYPAEMLTMDMQLEGDLGIDSIKRVEILSAMQEKEPSLPEVDASAMASLQTLG
ncbi:MAG: acyl transferase domain-containing protein, partial [Myxococcota bacterium]